jgi:hypothetical protein
MTTENHPIDQLFKERLGNFEQVPPVGLLDKINQDIAFRGRVRRMNQVRTISSIAAALVLIAMAGWYTLDLNPVTKNEFSQQIRTDNAPVQPGVEKGTLVQSTLSGKEPASQQDNKKPASAQLVGHFASRSIPKKNISKSDVSVGNEAGAAQLTGKRTELPDQLAEGLGQESPNKEDTATTNEKKQPENGTQSVQKKNEPLYFADSKLTPDPSTTTSRRGNWSIRAEVSPMFPSESLGSNSKVSPDTKSMGTVSGGMMASYQVNDRIKISSGIRFSQMKQGTHTDYTLSKTSGITYLQPVEKAGNISRDVSLYLPSVSSIVYSNGMNANAAYATSTNITSRFESDVFQEFKYLEVPIQATYKLIDQKQLTVGLTGGVSTNFLIGNLASITQNGIKLSRGDTDNLRNVLYSGSAGIELGYDLGKNLVLTVEPRIKQYLHSVSSNDLITYRPLQLGIFTGITYSFY